MRKKYCIYEYCDEEISQYTRLGVAVVLPLCAMPKPAAYKFHFVLNGERVGEDGVGATLRQKPVFEVSYNIQFHLLYRIYIVYLPFVQKYYRVVLTHTHTHRTHECRVVYTMFILVERFWSASDFFFVCKLTLHWFVRSPGWIQNVLENDCALDCRASDVYIWGCTFVSFGNDNGLGVFGVSWLSYSCRRIDFAIIIIMAMKVPHKHTHI